MSEFYDPELYKRFRKFVITACNKLEGFLEKGEKIPDKMRNRLIIKEDEWSEVSESTPNYRHFLLNHRDELQSLEKAKKVAEWMSSNKNIPKPVLTDSEGKPIEEPNYIPSFLHEAFNFLIKYFEKTSEVSFVEEEFTNLYRQYENYLFTRKVLYKIYCPITNFEMDIDELEIKDESKIRRITHDEIQTLYYESDFFGGLIPKNEIPEIKFVLYCEAETEDSRKQLKQINDEFMEIFSALRLFKDGFFQHGIIRQTPLTWCSAYTPFLLSLKPYIRLMGKRYYLSKTEAEEFKKFYQFYEENDSVKLFELGIRRLNFTYERTRPEDKLIDLTIAFESLFGEEGVRIYPKGSFIGTACSMLLGNSNEERKKIKKQIQDGFTLRNNVVHGSTYDKDEVSEIVPILESLLRKSIKKLLLPNHLELP